MTHTDEPPAGMFWCGSDAVLLQWSELLLGVGPYGDHCKWQLPDEVGQGVRLCVGSGGGGGAWRKGCVCVCV